MNSKALFTALLGSVLPLAVSAQVVTDLTTAHAPLMGDDQVELLLPQECGYKAMQHPTGATIYTPAVAGAKAGIQTVTVTFKYDFDKNNAAPLGVTIYNPTVGVIPVDKKGTAATFTYQVPVGTYDMHAMFKGKPTGSFAVFKENVTITADTTLTFAKADATVPFTFTFKDENGTALTLDKYNGGTVVEHGNVNSYRSYSFFALKGMGVIHTIIGGPYRVKGYDVDYYMNKVSDRFTLLHAANMRSTINKKTYFFKFEAPMNASASMSNNPADLKCYKQKFVPTKAGAQDESAHIFGCRVWCSYDGKWLLSGKAENKSMVLANHENEIFIDLPEDENGGFNVMVSPMMGDTYVAGNKQYRHIVGLPVAGNSKRLHFVDYGYDISDGFIVPVGGGVPVVYPGNPALSWFSTGDNAPYVYGNSCPLLSVKAKDYNGKSTKLLTFLGRYGEIYESYANTVARSLQEAGEFTDFTFKQENVMVDEVSGQNLTVLHCKNKGADITAPSIQMLRFVDNKGKISDRVDDAQEGMLEFVAGDLQYHHDNKVAYNRYYDCQAIKTVEVACAPHGTTNWQTLEAKEVPENFFMPGFGYFYRTSLAGVEGKNEWFDLQIKLTDETGNSHTQTLAPAFYMKKGASAVNSVSMAQEMTYSHGIVALSVPASIGVYSIDGKCVLSTQGTMLDLSGLSKGVYVVKATTATGRIMSAKVAR